MLTGNEKGLAFFSSILNTYANTNNTTDARGHNKMAVKDKETGEVSMVDVTVSRDDCNRPDTQLEALAGMNPINIEKDPNATITAGNASQLSDGASACVLMEEKEAERRGLQPLGAFKGAFIIVPKLNYIDWTRH